ncbi:Sodium-dependent phosphate transport protein 4 [Armadillidium vulgare]|nr:Sodium-dependent phosphate transport protein 4 [Armadillidium vulgare]
MSSNLGSTLAMLFSGYVISLLGWEFVFYISGSFSLLCLTLWIFFLFDKPETHPRISLQEKRYIIDSLKERNLKKKPDNVLWLKMLKSLPVWAINFGHAGSMCGLGFLVTQLPIYLSSIIGVNIRNNGLLSALPFIGRLAGGNISSWLLHYIMQKCHWQLKTMRIVANTIGVKTIV